MEFGTGLHGEPGCQRQPLKPTTDIVKMLLDDMLHEDEENVIKVPIVVLVNNLGCGTKLEERVFMCEVMSQLEAREIQVLRVYCMTVMTCLNKVKSSLFVFINISE